jgi:hypothetical protein
MQRLLAAGFAIVLAACGGGGGGASMSASAPGNGGNGSLPPPVSSSSNGPTIIADTTGRVGLFQEFDRFMTSGQIQADAPHYDAVWGASQPQLWNSGHPGIVTMRYFIPQEDRLMESGHDITWFQTNHPEWILYACRADGTPTHDYAYWAGVDVADVPLDFHNPDVIDYQVRQLNGMNAIQNGDAALAIDQIIFSNAMVGGNPNFGQTVKPGEYACGVWQGSTFVRRYTGVNDPAWTADSIAFVKTARQIVKSDSTLAPYHLKIVVNHPLGALSDPREQELLANVDGLVDERGYADRGRYTGAGDANLFKATTQYLIYLQKHGIAAFVINSFQDPAVTADQREYALAAYYMANEGGEDIYISPSTGGLNENFPEYAVQLGKPCEEYHGGPDIYYRRYSGGLVVLNSGSLPKAAVSASLPANHTYADVDGRRVTNPLSVSSGDGYILTTTNGCS